MKLYLRLSKVYLTFMVVQNVTAEISRRSTESLMRLAETKITVAGDLRKEVAGNNI